MYNIKKFLCTISEESPVTDGCAGKDMWTVGQKKEMMDGCMTPIPESSSCCTTHVQYTHERYVSPELNGVINNLMWGWSNVHTTEDS